MTRKRGILLSTATMLLVSGLLIGCGGAAPAPAPTKAPAAPAPTTAAAPAPAATTAAAPAPAPTKAPAAAPARAEGFFKGKTINVLLPNSAGGANDRSLRYVMPFIQEAAGASNHMVENAPGAGGMLGFNKFYGLKNDGLNWGAGSVASMILQQMSGAEGVRWDVTKVTYLGRFYNEPRLLLTPTKSNIKTVEDAQKLGRPLNLPIQGLDEDNLSMFLTINFLGLQGKLITGYQGESEVYLAAMRGEGDWVMASMTAAAPMIKNGDMVPVMVIGPERVKDYPNAPSVMEVLKDPAAKESMTAVTNIMQLLISVYLPPAVDDKVVAEARWAVDKALTVPKVAEDMPGKTGGRNLYYMKGEELQTKVNQIMSQSGKLTPLLKKALESVK